jgi:CRP-like cAMP-binding protein
MTSPTCDRGTIYTLAVATANDVLGGVSLFSMLEPTALNELARAAHPLGYKSGTILTDEDQTGSLFFVVVSGELTVRIRNRDIRRIGPGDYFGEMALIDLNPHGAQVIAETDVACLVFSRSTFRPFAMTHPEVAWALLEMMVQRVRDAEARSVDRALTPSEFPDPGPP